jgi:hypothetical protein
MRNPPGFRVHLGGDAVGLATGDVAQLLQFHHAGMKLVSIPLADDDKIFHVVIIDLGKKGKKCGLQTAPFARQRR